MRLLLLVFLGVAALLLGLLDSLALGLVGEDGSSFPLLVALVLVLDLFGLALVAILNLGHGIATATLLKDSASERLATAALKGIDRAIAATTATKTECGA